MLQSCDFEPWLIWHQSLCSIRIHYQSFQCWLPLMTVVIYEVGVAVCCGESVREGLRGCHWAAPEEVVPSLTSFLWWNQVGRIRKTEKGRSPVVEPVQGLITSEPLALLLVSWLRWGLSQSPGRLISRGCILQRVWFLALLCMFLFRGHSLAGEGTGESPWSVCERPKQCLL